jgi:gamma-glutamylcyclotransferase (GGCT)/AIG2-like uncharacterized protein YtfP
MSTRASKDGFDVSDVAGYYSAQARRQSKETLSSRRPSQDPESDGAAGYYFAQARRQSKEDLATAPAHDRHRGGTVHENLLSSSHSTSKAVLVYGSLQRGLRNHHVLEGASFVRYAKTRQATILLVDSGHGFPMAFDAAHGTAISGELWAVCDAVLAKLDALEGHPDYFCRHKVALDDDSTAWMYFRNAKALEHVQRHPERFPIVAPPGDWRAYHDAKPGAWLSTRITQGTPGPHACFSYGSNGIEQLRERCQNPKLVAARARLPEARRGCPRHGAASVAGAGGGPARSRRSRGRRARRCAGASST